MAASDLIATHVRNCYRCSIPRLAEFTTKRCAGPEAIWRKGWDSNPRNPFEVHYISNVASSTTPAPFRFVKLSKFGLPALAGIRPNQPKKPPKGGTPSTSLILRLRQQPLLFQRPVRTFRHRRPSNYRPRPLAMHLRSVRPRKARAAISPIRRRKWQGRCCVPG